MTRHLGVSAFLSVLIVVFFAVALYQPEGPAEPASALGADRKGSVLAPAEGPWPVPTVDVQPAAVASGLPVVSTRTVSRRSVPTERAATRAEVTPPVQASPRPSASPGFEPVQTRPTRQARRAPGVRPAFIHADAGESVADVALRVYGSSDAARALWMANRDILPDRDARLSTATVLRTP